MNLANSVRAPNVVGEAQLLIMYQNRQVVLFNTLPLFGAAWQKNVRAVFRQTQPLGSGQLEFCQVAFWCPVPTRISALLRLRNEATTDARAYGVNKLSAPDHRTDSGILRRRPARH